MIKTLQSLICDTGYSSGPGGTFNGHITVKITGQPAKAYHRAGFKTKEDAIEWARQEVENLAAAVQAASIRTILTSKQQLRLGG